MLAAEWRRDGEAPISNETSNGWNEDKGPCNGASSRERRPYSCHGAQEGTRVSTGESESRKLPRGAAAA